MRVFGEPLSPPWSPLHSTLFHSVDVGKTSLLSISFFPTLLAADGALRRRVLGLFGGGRDEVWVNHDVSESLAALAPAAQALRVELQRLEPESRLLGVVALQAAQRDFYEKMYYMALYLKSHH